MKRYISLICLLCAFIFSLAISAEEITDFDRKEALQAYSVEDAYSAIQRSKETRKNFKPENDRTLASEDKSHEEFMELMESEDEEFYYDEIDKF